MNTKYSRSESDNVTLLVSNIMVGYGHRKLTILVDGESYSAVTTDMRMCDNLKDDDDEVVEQATKDAIRYVMAENYL